MNSPLRELDRPSPAICDLPVLMVPGLMCDARVFGPQLAALSGRVSVQVANVTDADNVEEMAARVLRQAPLRFALVGQGLGGTVAMAMLAQAPERVARLALVGTDPLPDRPAKQVWREGLIARSDAGDLAGVMADLVADCVLDGPKGDAVRSLCLAMAAGLGPDVFRRQAMALRDRPDLLHTLVRARPGALVMAGAGDRVCPRNSHDRLMSLLPAAQLVEVDGAGHLPTLEQPEKATEALEAWIRGGISSERIPSPA